MRIMHFKRYYIILLILLLSVGVAHSQQRREQTGRNSYSGVGNVDFDTTSEGIRISKRIENIEVHFKFDKSELDLDYMGNNESLQNFARKIDSIGISRIDSIVIISQSSPEGVYEHNIKLSRNRASTMRKYILDKHPQLRNNLRVYDDGESWQQLREYVEKDTLMKSSSIERVLSVIDSDVNVGTKKWRMQQLPVYKYLVKTYYPLIRNSSFYILYYTEVEQAEAVGASAGYIVSEPVIDASALRVESEPSATEEEPWSRQLHLKTNAVALGLGIANVAAEIDLAKHLSLSLPVYYSAWNYFKSTIKFRTFAVQPELRYWPSAKNEGFFAGAHFGMVYYNCAFDGDYRYQDHNREEPSLGGGLSLGYRLPISKNKRWRVEFSLGAGGYTCYYDKFHNTPDVKDGLMVESVKRTYWGIDQAAISLAYSFDLGKGGKR